MIYTSYYGALRELQQAHIRLVCISKTKPSWLPHIDQISILAPNNFTGHAWNFLDYRREYVMQLEELGVDAIKKELDKRKGDFALACYESRGDIKAGVKYCHRNIFAGWYEAKTGISIREFDPELVPKNIEFNF